MDIGDRPLLIAGTLLVVVGVQFISLGVIGEILSRTYFAASKENHISLEKILMMISKAKIMKFAVVGSGKFGRELTKIL